MGYHSRPMKPRLLSAGVVVVHREAPVWRYLLLRVFDYWDFPKGLVEPGETALEAACREVAEETSLTDLDFRWGHDYRDTGPYARGKVARYYIAETASSKVELLVNPELGMPEHHEFRWVEFQEARAMLSARVRPVLDWSRDVLGF
jgi:bis(5'-nucleosidyl)-tetraphosphatase